MNENEFESRLQRTPVKRPPSEWREQILVAADVNRRTPSIHELTSLRDATPRQAFAATWKRRLRELFWPHPVAWGALAAVWIAIGAVHLALHEPGPPLARVHIAASPDMPTMITMQRELLASWEEPAEQPKAVPSRHLPPQSCIERRRETFEA